MMLRTILFFDIFSAQKLWIKSIWGFLLWPYIFIESCCIQDIVLTLTDARGGCWQIMSRAQIFQTHPQLLKLNFLEFQKLNF